MITIHEFSEKTGLSKKAIKLYEELLILHPKRSKKNYRLYDEEDLERCKSIKTLKEAGLSLREIADLLSEESPSPIEFESLLTTKYWLLADQVTTLEGQRNNLRNLLFPEPKDGPKDTVCKNSCLRNGLLGKISWAIIDALRSSGAHAESNSLVQAMNAHFKNLDEGEICRITKECFDGKVESST